MKHFVTDWVGSCLIKGLIFLVNVLPLAWALAVARFLGSFVFFLHKRRRIAYANLKAAMGTRYEARDMKRIARKTYETIAQTAVEIFRSKKLNEKFLEQYITFEGIERLKDAVGQKKGVIFLAAHFGNWELLSNVAALLGYPIKILARDQKHSRMNDMLNEMRETLGNEVIGKGMAVRAIVKALRHNDIVGMLSDQSGGPSGAYVELFGRRTTTPTGVIGIAKRTGCIVLPSFIIRGKNGHHRVEILEPLSIPDTGDDEKDIAVGLRRYLEIVEHYVSLYPDQWLWGHKRWKYTLDKTILVLSDKKAGHLTQSRALVNLYDEMGARHNYSFRKVFCDVEYKTVFHRSIFHFFALICAPFIQGRLVVLKYFLKANSYEKIRRQYADIIVTCGSSTVPIGHLLKRENLAKTISIMKPPFPYACFQYDLIVLPEHDRFACKKQKTVRLKTTLSLTTTEMLEKERAALIERIGVCAGPVISVLFGGDTKKYCMDTETVRMSFDAIKRMCDEHEGTLLVTTSRRTRQDVIDCIKEQLADYARCKLLVIPTEKNIENVVYGMIGCADSVFVTEDSISMISESVQAAKKVFVLRMAASGLPKKHKMFQNSLQDDKLIVSCGYTTIEKEYSASCEQNEPKPLEERAVLLDVLEGIV